MKQRFIQDPVTFELVPREQYVSRASVAAPYVIPDIEPYQSMADGTMITSRSHHRAHLRQHGLTEIGNEVNAAVKMAQEASTQKVDRKAVRADIIEALRRHQR